MNTIIQTPHPLQSQSSFTYPCRARRDTFDFGPRHPETPNPTLGFVRRRAPARAAPTPPASAIPGLGCSGLGLSVQGRSKGSKRTIWLFGCFMGYIRIKITSVLQGFNGSFGIRSFCFGFRDEALFRMSDSISGGGISGSIGDSSVS